MGHEPFFGDLRLDYPLPPGYMKPLIRVGEAANPNVILI